MSECRQFPIAAQPFFVDRIAMSALLATSFAAGLVATVNPCGFAMLPAYLSYFLGTSDQRSGLAGVRRALAVSAWMALGFLLVFGTAGVLLTLGVRAIVEFIPWLAVVVGVGLVVLGIRTYRGHYLAVPFGSGRVDRSSVLRFGVSYAVASLSCTLPIFLSLVAGTFARATVFEGISAFVVYSLGMSLVITAITVTMAFGQDQIVRLVRNSARYVSKVSGVVLAGAGLFIVWYWVTVLSSGSLALADNGPVRWVDALSSSITSFVSDRPLVVAGGLLAAVAGVVLALRAREHGRTADDPEFSRTSG
jgi:cytochrome c biogenesis protein CcdA